MATKKCSPQATQCKYKRLLSPLLGSSASSRRLAGRAAPAPAPAPRWERFFDARPKVQRPLATRRAICCQCPEVAPPSGQEAPLATRTLALLSSTRSFWAISRRNRSMPTSNTSGWRRSRTFSDKPTSSGCRCYCYYRLGLRVPRRSTSAILRRRPAMTPMARGSTPAKTAPGWRSTTSVISW